MVIIEEELENLFLLCYQERMKFMNKLIITAAICGAEVTKEQNPAVPYTIEEIVREAKSAADAGAAVIHLHVREDDGTPTQSKDRYEEAITAIRKVLPDIIILPSTGGATWMTAKERLQPVFLKPEIATLDCGTCNFGGDEVFTNTVTMIQEFAETTRHLHHPHRIAYPASRIWQPFV